MAHTVRAGNDRGRHATRPQEVPARGWRDVLLRVKSEMDKDNLSIVAAGVAFYFLLSIFPALAAFISIYGLLNDPADAQQQVQSFSEIMPAEARNILLAQMQKLTAGSSSALGFGALFGLLLALWSTMKGTMALITALNIVYGETEQRGMIKLYLVAFLLTVGAVLFLVLSLSLIAVIPPILERLGIGSWIETAFNVARWPILALVVITMLSVVYRFAPSRSRPRWRWVNPGSLTAAALWLISTALFSWYVSSFGSYNETYGSLGALVILLMWFYITSYIFLMGGELNAELERQTKEDTTETGQPLGKRGAYAADTVGKKP